jgi:tRNA (cmo5U34)-methyltransferase
LVPGFLALQRMALLLLAERARDDARILVVGAGGGLELKVFAEAHAGWTFEGVDPAAAMLELAATTLGPLASRVTLHEGYVDVAPTGPFDGAACLLTLHFVDAVERRRIAAEVHERLQPGAPFVVAHFSAPTADRAQWLARYEAFAVDSGVAPDAARKGREGVAQHLHILSPEEDVAVLTDAGFSGVSLFFKAFTFSGWVGYA